MWARTLPAEDENLRQGDLLVDVPVPILGLKPETTSSGQTNLKIKLKHCLVVSQCCTIERRGVVQLAFVVKTSQMDPSHPMWQALHSNWPARQGDLMYDAIRLDPPVSGALAELETNRLWMADFRTGVTFTNDPRWLRAHLRARMDAVARRSLRMRLAAFYSRSTDGDRSELDGIGEWADAETAPDWVRKTSPG